MLKITPHSPKAAEAQPLTTDHLKESDRSVLVRGVHTNSLYLAWRGLDQDSHEFCTFNLQTGALCNCGRLANYHVVPASEQHTFTFQNQP